MSSRAEYLKKYLSNGKNEEKKKKKSGKLDKEKPMGMRLIEEDAFLSVDAAKQKEVGSDEEREEIEVLKESVKKAKVVSGFKKTFSEVEVKVEVKNEPLTPEYPLAASPSRDSSPLRRERRSSPMRRKRHDSDESPPRRQRHDSDSSPPKNTRRQRHDSDNSPPRNTRRQRQDSYRDNSPPRKKRHDSDNSPPRRQNDDRDNSPVHRKRRNSDNSPPRRERGNNGRKSRSPDARKIAKPVKIKSEVDSDEEVGVGKTLDGKRSGLQSAKALREESDKLKAKNEKLFDDMDSAVSGRDASTVYRQKQTKKKGKDTEEERAKKERETKKTEELKEKYKDWNRGAAQIEERRQQLEEMARVAAEPMTRRQDDVEMNRHLKEVLHESDPMANIIRKKKRDTAIDQGELVYPTYQGTWVPNRFGVAPGYRWDGVDRSNGFEGKLAKTANQKTANQSEYYKSIAEYE